MQTATKPTTRNPFQPTKARILKLCRDRRRQTWFCKQTNQSHYPARWTMGDGVGDADTADYYDSRTERARERVIEELATDIRDSMDEQLDEADYDDVAIDRMDDRAHEARRFIREVAEAWRQDD